MNDYQRLVTQLVDLARDIGTVQIVEERNTAPNPDRKAMLARLSEWRSRVLRAADDVEKLASPPPDEPPTPEAAFRAGYHCRWHKEMGRYNFDPAMAPGDPEGAYLAWLNYGAAPPDEPTEKRKP